MAMNSVICLKCKVNNWLNIKSAESGGRPDEKIVGILYK